MLASHIFIYVMLIICQVISKVNKYLLLNLYSFIMSLISIGLPSEYQPGLDRLLQQKLWSQIH